MKRLMAIGFIALLSISLEGCKVTSDDTKKDAREVNPEDFLGRAPAGIPKEEGRLYEVTGLDGLISHGNSLLVQVSPLSSREALAWDHHAEDANQAATVFFRGESSEKLPVGSGRIPLARVPSPSNGELEFKYFYVQPEENDKQKGKYRLRAVCFGRNRLYEPVSTCFFSYRTSEGHIEFTLDEQAIASGHLSAIEDVVFNVLGVERSMVE